MRTTIEISDILMSELQERAVRDGSTLKDEVNRCLAVGLGRDRGSRLPWRAETFHMGGSIPDKALALADGLEMEAVVAKRELRK